MLFEKREKEEREKEYLQGIAYGCVLFLTDRKKVAMRDAPRTQTKEGTSKPVEKEAPSKDYCLSYLRTGCCRFGARCKMIHVWPKRSRGVLIHVYFVSRYHCVEYVPTTGSGKRRGLIERLPRSTAPILAFSVVHRRGDRAALCRLLPGRLSRDGEVRSVALPSGGVQSPPLSPRQRVLRVGDARVRREGAEGVAGTVLRGEGGGCGVDA